MNFWYLKNHSAGKTGFHVLKIPSLSLRSKRFRASSPTNAASDWRGAGSVDYLAFETSIKAGMFCFRASQIWSYLICGRRLQILWTDIYLNPVRVKGGMSLRNGMWHGLRNDIIMRNLIYADRFQRNKLN